MSSQLTQRDSLDTESEVLPQVPPPWVIGWTSSASARWYEGQREYHCLWPTLIEYAFEPIRQLRESMKQ
jgi:hypothetical protein